MVYTEFYTGLGKPVSKMEKTKIVVKIGVDPDVKEVIVGEKLTVIRVDGVVQIRDGDELVGEFDHIVYWRYVDVPDPDRLRLLQAVHLKIQGILDDGQVNDDIRLAKIQKLMYEEGQLELIQEPDKELLLLNLGYLDTFVERLTPGMDTETLAWCMYAVKQFAEHNLVPGGPADPGDPEWSWEKFKNSFRPAKVVD